MSSPMVISQASNTAQETLLFLAPDLTPGQIQVLLANPKGARIKVPLQGPCLVRGPLCGQKAGLFPEEEGHHAI